MRSVFVLACVALALTAALAQAPETLTASKSLMAVKITNPEQQFTVFSPLLALLDGLVPAQAPGGKDAKTAMTSASTMVKTMVETLKRLPGVNARGSVWVLFMPLPKGAPIPPFVTEDGVMKPNPDLVPPVYLVLPLTDPQAFQQFIAANPRDTKLRYKVCGNFAVGTDDKVPPFTAVHLDLPLTTARDIAFSVQVGNYDLEAVNENLPPMLAPLLAPMNDVIMEQKENVQRIEVGATMLDKDLSLESYIHAVPQSRLAREIAKGAADGVAAEYTGYLPKNLAYMGAGNSALPGAQGSAYNVMRVGFGILGVLLPPERSPAFIDSYQTLMRQCSQGRALGITVPTDPRLGATLVGVYRVTNEKDASAAVRTFMKELSLTRQTVMSGMLSNIITCKLLPDAEKCAGVPVDLVTISITPPAPAPAANGKAEDGKAKAAAPVTVNMQCRIAYLGDKMLVTLGGESAGEMTGLIQRVRAKDAGGFTTTECYQQLKQAVSAKARCMETIALRDMCMVVTSWFPPGQQRTDAQTFLSLFPPRCAPITSFQEMRDGRLYGEMRIPGGQLDFIYSLLKAIQTTAKPQPQPQPQP